MLDAAADRVLQAAVPAARRHRLGQDRGLPARGRRRARAGSGGDRAGARDRADAADRRPFHRALRRDRRGAALAADAPASATRSGAGCARARRASASARARPSSRRSRTRPDRRSTRSTTPPTSTRATPATTPATWPPSAPAPKRRAAARGQRHPAAGEPSTGCPHRALPRRVDGRPLPAVSGARHARRSARACIPSPPQALAEVRDRRGKAIVLLNRRGWSNFLSCRSCGRVWGCPECDVALVLHRAGGYLACHHCGHRERAPALPDCASTSVASPRRRHRAPGPRARRGARRRRVSRSSGSTRDVLGRVAGRPSRAGAARASRQPTAAC